LKGKAREEGEEDSKKQSSSDPLKRRRQIYRLALRGVKERVIDPEFFVVLTDGRAARMKKRG